MLGKEFRSLAEAVTHTYGSDPWFFLRELAQNSRDAGAKNIWVAAERDAFGSETLTFADDGKGMSLAHARRFLFRLYASDKTGDTASAGKYGIGFWTILGFQPGQVWLQSRSGKGSWAMVLDADLRAQPAPCTLTRRGTTVCLVRPAVFSSAAEFSSAVENALRNYCRFLRRNDRHGTVLPVFFHERDITVPMRLPGPLTYSFHHGAVEGAVGLGEKPLVRLYARGLPVWEGAFLGEMSQLQTHVKGQSEIGRGLYPVFLLNGNRLDVTFSRNLALENKALEQVEKMAEKALERLLANALERAFPRTWYQRSRDYLHVLGGRLGRPGWLWLPLLLLVVLPLEIVLLNRFFPMKTRSLGNYFDLNAASIQYSGATVGSSFSELSAHFSYAPGDTRWFKVFTAADYDEYSGFIRRGTEVFTPASSSRSCAPEQTVSMRFSASAAGRVMLPLPLGHAIDPASVVGGKGHRRLACYSNNLGEWNAEIPAAPETVNYRSCPESRKTELAATEIDRLTRLPAAMEWPAEFETALAAARSLPVSEKAALARAMVRAAVGYDISEPTVRLYRQFAHGQTWLARVLAIGKGDCDVINGVNVLLLRRMGVPARLAVGLIGSRGRIGPGLHAWSEYFDRGWQIVDASAATDLAATPAASRSERPLPTGSDPAVWTSPLPERFFGKSNILVAVGLAAMALPLIIVWLSGRKRQRRRAAMLPPPQGKELILPLIQQAVLQPEIWGRQSPLWNHRFLPTIHGRPMAIRRAFTLLRRGRLLFCTSLNPLAAAMNNRDMPILDLRQSFFTPLLNLIPGALNLDLLLQLQPLPLPKLENGSEDLLAAVNALLSKKLRKTTLCLLSPGLHDADFFNVSLPFTPNQRRFFFPRRFIAVNPAGKRLAELSILFKQNRSLAVFRFLQALNSVSLLPVADPHAFLRKTARQLLRQGP